MWWETYMSQIALAQSVANGRDERDVWRRKPLAIVDGNTNGRHQGAVRRSVAVPQEGGSGTPNACHVAANDGRSTRGQLRGIRGRMLVWGRAISRDRAADSRRHLPLHDVPQAFWCTRTGLVHFRAGDFAWTRGAPTRFKSSDTRIAASVPTVAARFRCTRKILNDRVQIAVGSLDDPSGVRIDDHVWTDQQIPWFRVADDLPRFHQSSSAVPSKASGNSSET